MNQYTNPTNKVKKQKLQLKTKEELSNLIEEKDKRIQYLEELITQKMTDCENLQKKLEKAQEKQQKQSNTKIKYKKETSWVGKIVTTLTANNRPMQSSEIISHIEENYKETFKNAIVKSKHLSPNLVKAVKYGRIKKYRINGVLGHFYGLPQWFDENGKLKKEYKEKESIV